MIYYLHLFGYKTFNNVMEALTKFHFSSCNFQEIILVPMFYFYLKISNYLEKKMVLVFYKNHSLFFMIIFLIIMSLHDYS
jgi:hypothetical protein